MKVRLDACETRNGIVWYGDAPLTGVGAEVGNSVQAHGRAAGKVILWRYQDGRRGDVWTPPLIGPSLSVVEPVLIDELGQVEQGELLETRTCFDNTPLTGWVVEFIEDYVQAAHLYRDGFAEPEYLRWHPDGSLAASSNYSHVSVEDGVVEVVQRHQWPEAVAMDPQQVRPSRSAMQVAGGDMFDLPTDYAGHPVAGPRFSATIDKRSSTLELTRSESGQLEALHLHGETHFDALASSRFVDPLGWMPLSWAELRDIEPASTFALQTNTVALQAAFTGLGGASWFDPVRALHLSLPITADHLAMLLERPALERVDFGADRSWDPERLEQVSDLCRDYEVRRPDLQITLP